MLSVLIVIWSHIHCFALLPSNIAPFLVQSLVRRRACQVVCAGVTVWAGGDAPKAEDSSFTHQLLAGDAVAPLLQLLSDPDPGVALAATQALGRLYQVMLLQPRSDFMVANGLDAPYKFCQHCSWCPLSLRGNLLPRTLTCEMAYFILGEIYEPNIGYLEVIFLTHNW